MGRNVMETRAMHKLVLYETARPFQSIVSGNVGTVFGLGEAGTLGMDQHRCSCDTPPPPWGPQMAPQRIPEP